MAFDFCRPGGQVLLLGMGTQRSEVNFVTSIRKEHRRRSRLLLEAPQPIGRHLFRLWQFFFE
jgi:hypothetical protein